MNFWDERYAGEEYFYGHDPNVFIAECLLNQPEKGKILFPAEGEGRNAVFAARLGWDVDAFDSSIQAMRKAQNLAKKHKVIITYSLEDLREFKPKPDTYQAIALCFVHMPPEFRKSVHMNMLDGLKTGGRILIEAYSKDQLNYKTGGPDDENMLLTPDELTADFDRLRIIYLEKKLTFLAEGKHHGISSVVRMIAEKQQT